MVQALNFLEEGNMERSANETVPIKSTKGIAGFPKVKKPADLRAGDAMVISGSHVRLITDVDILAPADIVEFMTPTDDNRQQVKGMQRNGFFTDIIEEIGDIIVANINKQTVSELLENDGQGINELITK